MVSFIVASGQVFEKMTNWQPVALIIWSHLCFRVNNCVFSKENKAFFVNLATVFYFLFSASMVFWPFTSKQNNAAFNQFCLDDLKLLLRTIIIWVEENRLKKTWMQLLLPERVLNNNVQCRFIGHFSTKFSSFFPSHSSNCFNSNVSVKRRDFILSDRYILFVIFFVKINLIF